MGSSVRRSSENIRGPPKAPETARSGTFQQLVQAIRQNNHRASPSWSASVSTDALGKFQTACIMDPESEVGCMNMGIAFLNMQRYEDARRVLNEIRFPQAQNPVPWFNLGLLEKDRRPDKRRAQGI